MNETQPERARELTREELDEIARLARFVRKRPVWMAVPLTLFFWPLFIVSVINMRFPDPIGMLIYGFLGVMTIYWEWQVFAGRRLYALLLRDREDGKVAVDSRTGREALPISGMEWTVDGEPASWRGHPPPMPAS